ncbi:MAG: ABC transporter permease subunit [Lachnospiraceae bacterium]|nr:ABC transporter permease subunit [Lachnospiraceae bacterium]
MLAIYKRELRSYFHSMIAYLFIAGLCFFIGVYFLLVNVVQGNVYFCRILSNIMFLFMFIFPILTMRSMAEERRSKTDQLLLTSPVTIPEIVMGKFCAMATVYAVPCLIAAVCPLLMLFLDEHHLTTDLVGIIPFFLVGCVYIAIGMFLSSLTENQIIAAALSVIVFLLLYLAPAFQAFYPESALASAIGLGVLAVFIAFIYYSFSKNAPVSGGILLAEIAAIVIIFFAKKDLLTGLVPKLFESVFLTAPLDTLSQYQILDLSGIVFYLSLIGLFIFLTVIIVQKRRWN